MKLLRAEFDGLQLFKGKNVIDFFAEQRVASNNCEMLSNIFGKTFTNNVISIVGINASGKTSLLKVISFVMEYINGQSINNIYNRNILDGAKSVTLEVIFYDEKSTVYKLRSKIKAVVENGIDTRYIIEEEELFKKKTTIIRSKKELVTFDNSMICRKRDNSAEFLKDDISIVISVNKKNTVVKDLLNTTDTNYLALIGDFPQELITFLDPSIEEIRYDKKNKETTLKFYGKKKISLSSPIMLQKYLSSGTIKGFNIFVNAMIVFSLGGYLIVDELENHFNREIVATLVRFFMNARVNKRGATLIFSTHYSELLDEFERNDSIFIVRNRDGIAAQKLSDVLKRNDIKKSEAFKSGYLEGTVPMYDAYIALKEAILAGKMKEA